MARSRGGRRACRRCHRRLRGGGEEEDAAAAALAGMNRVRYARVPRGETLEFSEHPAGFEGTDMAAFLASVRHRFGDPPAELAGKLVNIVMRPIAGGDKWEVQGGIRAGEIRAAVLLYLKRRGSEDSPAYKLLSRSGSAALHPGVGREVAGAVVMAHDAARRVSSAEGLVRALCAYITEVRRVLGGDEVERPLGEMLGEFVARYGAEGSGPAAAAAAAAAPPVAAAAAASAAPAPWSIEARRRAMEEVAFAEERARRDQELMFGGPGSATVTGRRAREGAAYTPADRSLEPWRRHRRDPFGIDDGSSDEGY